MSEPLVTKSLFWRVALVFAWYDFWIGLYWNREKKWLYIPPVPMLGLRVDLHD